MILTLTHLVQLEASGVVARLMRQPLPFAAAWKFRRIARALGPEIVTLRDLIAATLTDENSSVDTAGRRIPKDAVQFDRDCGVLFAGRAVELAVEPLTTAELASATLSADDIGLLADSGLLTDASVV